MLQFKIPFGNVFNEQNTRDREGLATKFKILKLIIYKQLLDTGSDINRSISTDSRTRPR
ncbi:MAG: hypothetical protein ACFB02_04650 [Mastigocoleus sp.]